MVADTDMALMKRISNGWVPFNVLTDASGVATFIENEFDEQGYTREIQKLLGIEAPSEQAIVRRQPATPAKTEGPRTIVILGGGTGGVVAANTLRKQLGSEHRIVVIDRVPNHIYAPSLLWLMTGKRTPDQIQRPLDRLKDKGIEFHEANVQEIDTSARKVITSTGEHEYDYLIIALGAELKPDLVPGFEEQALNLYSLDGCLEIQSRLERFEGGTIAIFIPQMPYKCAAAPYEAATQIDAYVRKKGKTIRGKTQIHVLTPEHQVIPLASKSFGDRIERFVTKRGVTVQKLYTFKELRPSTSEVVDAEGNATKVDLLIGIPPHVAPAAVRTAGLLGPSGWVAVDANTLETDIEGVYAIGDVVDIKLPSGKLLPKAGVFAHFHAEVVAKNIVADIEKRTKNARYEGAGYCWFDTGNGKAAMARGNFYEGLEPKLWLTPPVRVLRWAKIAFEKWWLRHWF